MTNQFQRIESVADLLGAAGPRESPRTDRAVRVESAVRAEWKAVVRKRHGRRRARWLAVGSLVSAAMVTVILHVPPRAAHLAARDSMISVSGVAAEEAAPGFSRARTVLPAATGTSRPETGKEDRVPDGGLPRRILVTYTWETR